MIPLRSAGTIDYYFRLLEYNISIRLEDSVFASVRIAFVACVFIKLQAFLQMVAAHGNLAAHGSGAEHHDSNSRNLSYEQWKVPGSASGSFPCDGRTVLCSRLPPASSRYILIF